MKDTKGTKKKKKNIKKKADTWPVVTGVKAAALLGVTLRTLQRYAKAGMPVEGRNQYHIIRVHNWDKDQLRAELGARDPIREREKTAVTVVKEKQAQIYDRRLQKMDGLLLDAEEVERERVNRIVAVKEALLHLPVTLARKLGGLEEVAEREAIIAGEVKKVCHRFADAEEQTAAAAAAEGLRFKVEGSGKVEGRRSKVEGEKENKKILAAKKLKKRKKKKKSKVGSRKSKVESRKLKVES